MQDLSCAVADAESLIAGDSAADFAAKFDRLTALQTWRISAAIVARKTDAMGRTNRFRKLCLAIAGGLAAQPAIAVATPANPAPNGKTWSDNAVADLREVRRLIEANTPGPVDPLNPDYKLWLESGFVEAMDLARKASGVDGYLNALRLYTNGFRDDHLGVNFTFDYTMKWPLFVTGMDEDGKQRVRVAEDDAPVPVGAELVDCDGKDANILLHDRVLRYRWNADIPHRKAGEAARLFYGPTDAAMPSRCRFKLDGRLQQIELAYQPITAEKLSTVWQQARRVFQPQMGIREQAGVWLISVPTFESDGKNFQSLFANVRKRLTELRSAPIVVIDVRGNGGGNSQWGEDLASILWGEPIVKSVSQSFDWTTDWRVSADNIRLTRELAERWRKEGSTEAADEKLARVKQLEAALARGESLVRVPSPPTSKGLAPGTKSPFAGQVYFLTDNACSSACLDFADIVRRMPGVAHVGKATGADSIYIDMLEKPLSSGLATLRWPVKVYRNRIRGNNEWYEPAVRWKGGAMTDEAVIAWIESLPKGPPNARRREGR